MPELSKVDMHQLPRVSAYMPNPSPACVRLETFLRLSRLPHAVHTSAQPGCNGRWPYVELHYLDGSKATLSDSWNIIQQICKDSGVTLPILRAEDLTPAQQLKGESIRLLVDNTAYFSLIRNRWVENKKDLLRTYRLGIRLPRFLQRMAFSYIRKELIHLLNEQGNGELSFAESEQWYVTVVKVIEEQLELSKGPFLFGDRPSVYDTVAWTALWVVYEPKLGSAAKEYVLGSKRLTTYVKLIQGLAFADMDTLTKETMAEEALGPSATVIAVLTAVTATFGALLYGAGLLGCSLYGRFIA